MKEIRTDVLIVGAGAAGIAAAIAAAENQCNVLLVEKHDFAGGNATIAEVGTVCGLFHNSFSNTDFLVRGFAREFAEKLQSLSNTVPTAGRDGLHYLPYRIGAFAELGRHYLNRKNITCLFNCQVENMHIQEGKILAVEAFGNEWVRIVPSAVIDCSGNSIVARLGNLGVITEPAYQSAAQVFSMEGIEEDREDRLSLQILKAVAHAGNSLSIDGYSAKLYLVPGSLKGGNASFKIALPFPIKDGSETDTQLAADSKKWVSLYVDYLSHTLTTWKHAKIHHIASSPGFRVGARTKGKYILTGNDVRTCQKFEDAIALCSWPVEEWNESGKVRMEYLAEYCYYNIPSGSLIAENTANLFMAGRIISADATAIASARVMGICLQTGYAAGVLAAAHHSGISSEEAIQQIQRRQIN